MKRSSTSKSARNTNQTTMRCHLTPVRMCFIKKSSNNKRCYLFGCGEKGTIAHCSWEYTLVQLLWETIWRFLKNVKIEQPNDTAIPLLHIYPKGWKLLFPSVSCMPMFIADLFTIPQIQKQSKCSRVNEWIKKM